VIYSHARRNAMIPVTTIGVGSAIGLLLGVFVTEWIFNIRGLGYLGVQSALNYDVPMMMGIALLDTTAIVFTSLIQDILYTIVDPRVRYS
jgi:peptide/nickel transport system permease protein